MGPDLDQSLSLKAQLKDLVSPALKKIEQGVKSTQQALNELKSHFSRVGQETGTATEGMATKTNQATERISTDLGKAGESFEKFGAKAKSSSREVGEALKDSLYTKDAGQRLRELDKELGSLKGSLEGLANKERSSSTSARRVKSLGKDTLNQKVIPAFQQLHATLSDYPDTLLRINRIEQDRIAGTKEFNNILGNVNERVTRFGDKLRELKLDAQDVAGAIMASLAYQAGNKLQSEQGAVAAVAGFDDAAKLPGIWKDALVTTQAPIDLWREGMMTLMELTEVSTDRMPELLGQFTSLSKITDLSVGNITAMEDSLVRLSGLRESDFTKVMHAMSQMAKEGRVSMEEMAAALTSASAELGLFTTQARKGFLEANLIGTSLSKELGMDQIDSFEDFKKRIETTEGYRDAMVAANQIGVGGQEFERLYKAGEVDKLYAYAQTGAQKLASGALNDYGRSGKFTPFERQGIESAIPTMNFSNEALATGKERFKQLGVRNFTREEIDALTAEQRKGLVGADATAAVEESYIRGLLPEQRERMAAVGEQGQIMVGEQAAPVIQNAQEGMLNFAQEGIAKVRKWDEQYNNMFTKAAAFFGLASPMTTALKNMASFAGFEGVAGALDTGLGGAITTALGALGLNNVFGGGAKGANLPEGVTASMALQDTSLKPYLAEVDKALAAQAREAGGQLPANIVTNEDLAQMRYSMVMELKQKDISGAMSQTGAPQDISGAMSQTGAPQAGELTPLAQAAQQVVSAQMTGVDPFAELQKGPSIMKALEGRIADVNVALSAMKLGLQLPKNKDEAGLMVKGLIEMKKTQIENQVGLVKDWVGQNIRTAHTALIGLIGGPEEIQRQQREILKEHTKILKEIATKKETEDKTNEQQQQQTQEAIRTSNEEIAKAMGVIMNASKKGKTQPLVLYDQPMQAAFESYEAQLAGKG